MCVTLTAIGVVSCRGELDVCEIGVCLFFGIGAPVEEGLLGHW